MELNRKCLINSFLIEFLNNKIMKISKRMPIDQNTQEMQGLAKKNGTTVSICGYITGAICDYLSEQDQFQEQTLSTISSKSMTPYIEKAMKWIAGSRRLEVKKYYKLMNPTQSANYMKDWVANYELASYLQSISDKMINPNVYFFRQCAFDHPKSMQLLKWEEKERVQQELPFKGESYFYSTFSPYTNHHAIQFEEELKKIDKTKPIIIATDVLGHFNVTVLWKGQVYILDSLSSYLETQYDSKIVEMITYFYKSSYLIKQQIKQ